MSRERRPIGPLIGTVLMLLAAGCGDDGAKGNKPVADAVQRCSLAEETCAPEEYCDFSDGSCGHSATLGLVDGVCQPRCPECACTLMLEPVCGCNGQTYASPCAVRTAGWAIAYAGLCHCGESECDVGTVCCNPLSGICTAPGMACALGAAAN